MTERRGDVVYPSIIALFFVALVVAAATVLAMAFRSALAKDAPAWAYEGADVKAWYASLKQPDYPQASCCGEADAYFADKVEACAAGDAPECVLVAIVTDTRDDASRNRIHRPPGTRVVIPANKIRKVPSYNPTDHNVVFLTTGGDPYCWEPVAGM